MGTGHDSDAAHLREFTEAISLGEDALDDVGCGRLAAPFDVEANASNMHERFKREAHLHIVIDGNSAGLTRPRHRSRDESCQLEDCAVSGVPPPPGLEAIGSAAPRWRCTR